MEYENLFSSSGRDPRKENKFVPLEEIPGRFLNPEEELIQNEAEEEEEDEEEEEFSLGLSSSEIDPPEDGTLYDKQIAHANDPRNIMPAPQFTGDISVPADELIPGEEIQEEMDVTGIRPNHRDRLNEKIWGAFRPPHGHRGKEHPDKHQKGGEKTQ